MLVGCLQKPENSCNGTRILTLEAFAREQRILLGLVVVGLLDCRYYPSSQINYFRRWIFARVGLTVFL